jgi:phage-related holin
LIQENKLILGFDSFKDLFDSILGLKNPIINFFMATIAACSTFITDYIWDDAPAVYFLLFLITIDAFTGVWKSYVYKTFRSSKLPRILVVSTIYVLMLAISWHAAKHSSLFVWLPGMVYGGLIGTQIVSIYENFSELGFLPKGLLYDIKERIQGYFKSKYGNKKDDDEESNVGY